MTDQRQQTSYSPSQKSECSDQGLQAKKSAKQSKKPPARDQGISLKNQIQRKLSGKLSTHTLGSTESLKAVYMGKTFQTIKPASPLNRNNVFVGSSPRIFSPMATKNSKSSMQTLGNGGKLTRKKNKSLATGPRGLRGISILSDQNIRFQDNAALLSPFQERTQPITFPEKTTQGSTKLDVAEPAATQTGSMQIKLQP